jgi:uncharacterized protein YecT (DUF1311 family)
MKQLTGIASLALMLAGSSAWAMDCAKAASALDKRICSDHELKAADTAMSAAYFKLLQSIKDPEIHASLIESQRRWVKAREQDLDSMPDWIDDPTDDNAQRAILLETTRARTQDLSSRSAGLPAFVATALKQRDLARGYSGGPYSGYRNTSCSFIADKGDHNHWTYNCFGSRAYQNGKRVCSETNDFASYRSVTTRAAAIVENGQLRKIASYSDDTGKWAKSSDPADSAETSRDSSRHIDPDAPFDNDDDKGWMRACLTDPSFPTGGKFDDR